MNNPKKVSREASPPKPLQLRQQNIIHDFEGASDSPPGPKALAAPRWAQLNAHNAQVRQVQNYNRGQGDHFRQPRMQQFAQVEPWKDWQKLSVIMTNVPRSWGTREIYTLLDIVGAHPLRIDMSYRPGNAKVIFRPPPRDASKWIFGGFNVTTDSGTRGYIHCKYEQETERDKIARQRGEFEEMELTGSSLAFGVQQWKDTMLVMRNVGVVRNVDAWAMDDVHPRLVVNLKKQHLDLHFSLRLGVEAAQNAQSFFLRIPFTEIRSIMEDRDFEGNTCFIIPLETPPLAFRKKREVLETHQDKSDLWDDRQTWYRQTSIEADPVLAGSRRTQLRNEGSYIDIGRWLCYRFVCAPSSEPFLQQLRVVLAKHNIPIHQTIVQYNDPRTRSLWDWLGTSVQSGAVSATSSFDLMNSSNVHLPFVVQYQLEACISKGCLHESSLSTPWLRHLLARDTDPATGRDDPKYPRATKLLEKVLESKQRFYDPMDIFQLGQDMDSNKKQKKMPHYCTLVRSATVTPTTIYFNSPSVDTSNRVIRKFREHEDRFLRVKFRDESYKGTIMTFDDDTNDELFSRVYRALKHGIVVGDRHYEFLAYGNSQFREHGAYFFAPTRTLTCQMIRDWMGNFESIKTVAKYASRIGQCFSTTRAMANSVEIERIPDIERNGYCFSDGVGKISAFSLQMSTREMNLPNCPSVIQFRLGGSKGVLACDPNLKGQVIQIRPSQEKFLAPYKGLEICRISKFATAYLNQQIVLVLSALGVPDEVFLVMLRRMLFKLETAMSDESVAVDLLTSNIDPNQSTTELAEMIEDGFMATQELFFMTNMRLWRAWSIKYLKEKAKIFVENGAFVMGVIDEIGILKGYYNIAIPSDTTHDVSMLPEIFLQVEDFQNKGTWKVVEGVCVLARNPSLHPGDARVVNAVNVPELLHMRDTVVLPSKGDRDIASMCSGGDLDGDDYLVMWDPNLIPEKSNHEPMDYTAPAPVTNDGSITVDDMTKFFVNHMKNDNLGRIATAHRYWADRTEEGVKHDNCLTLAALHSKAVDYAKSGVPAEMPKHLKVSRWPHWAEKDKSRSYRSKKILGQMYDEVDRVPFVPAWDLPFDDRILKAFELDDQMLSLAREVKFEYDEAIRRLMTQHTVRTEFEIWTTFIMEHNHESRDFKIAEELGETLVGLKKQFQDMCYERAGTTAEEREWKQLRLFVAAMYTVTAQEVAKANKECEERHLIAGRWVPNRERTTETIPLISFPWLFRRELGAIAMGKNGPGAMSTLPAHVRGALKPLQLTSPSISTSPGGGVQELEPLPVLSCANAEDRLRKDSMDLLPLTMDPFKSAVQDESPTRRKKSPLTASTTPATSITSDASATPNTPVSLGAPSKFDVRARNSASPDIEVLDNTLYESRAFGNSDVLGFDTDLAKIDALAAEPSGGYEDMLLPPANVTLEPLNDSGDEVEHSLALVPFDDVTDDAEHSVAPDPFRDLTDAIKHKLALEPFKDATDDVGYDEVEEDDQGEEVEVS
jgi:RNA-dependent RNA polymerase